MVMMLFLNSVCKEMLNFETMYIHIYLYEIKQLHLTCYSYNLSEFHFLGANTILLEVAMVLEYKIVIKIFFCFCSFI